MSILSDIKAYSRFVWAFPDFLRDTMSLADAQAMLQRQLAERESNFLNLVEHGIYGYPNSPYLRLLKLAHCELGDIQNITRKAGLENLLHMLREAGVYLSFEEFKCRKPIERSGRVISLQMRDLDNPLLSQHFEARTSGSRGLGSSVLIDLDFLRHEAAAHALFLSTFDIEGRPMALWRPRPPGLAGVLSALNHAKLGKKAERWFAQNKVTFRPGNLKYLFFTNFIVHSSRMRLKALPVPENVPVAHAVRVARWLQAKCEQATPALLDTNVSSGIRVCQAAKEHNMDIEGTLFRFGGEPYTPARARIVASTGSRAICHYSMTEVGRIGLACAAPETLDDVHLLTNKLAVIQHERPVGDGRTSVGALQLTTLLPSCPKILLNVEIDDYGMLVERNCGCPLQEFGYNQHLHTIRSFDKITSAGMQFLASDLISLVEEVLPARFGGHPTDYQFEEEQMDGLPKVSIIISPRVGQVNEPKVIDTVLRDLRVQKGGYEMMADHWRQGRTLQVVRREPYHTYTGKILPLHISAKK